MNWTFKVSLGLHIAVAKWILMYQMVAKRYLHTYLCDISDGRDSSAISEEFLK